MDIHTTKLFLGYGQDSIVLSQNCQSSLVKINVALHKYCVLYHEHHIFQTPCVFHITLHLKYQNFKKSTVLCNFLMLNETACT